MNTAVDASDSVPVSPSTASTSSKRPRPGRWPLATAAREAGVSHKVARTVIASHRLPEGFTFNTGADLLALRLVGEAWLATPPLQRPRGEDSRAASARDRQLLHVAEDAWKEATLDSVVLLTTGVAVLAEPDALPGYLRTYGGTEAMVLLPVGKWVRELRERWEGS